MARQCNVAANGTAVSLLAVPGLSILLMLGMAANDHRGAAFVCGPSLVWRCLDDLAKAWLFSPRCDLAGLHRGFFRVQSGGGWGRPTQRITGPFDGL